MIGIVSRFKDIEAQVVVVSGQPIAKDWNGPAIPDPLRVQVFVHSQRVLYEAYTPNSSQDHQSWKPFQHYKVAWAPGGGNGMHILCHWHGWTYEVVVPYGSTGWWDGGQAQVYQPWMDDVPDSLYPIASSGTEYIVSPPPGHGELRQNALRSMLPGLKARLSLLNSIYELKDMKSVPKTVRNIRDFLRFAGGGYSLRRAALNAMNSNTRRGYLGLLHSHSKQAADAYLQTQFNVLPLISDIAGIYTAICSVQKDLRKLLGNAGKLCEAHWRHSFNISSAGSNHHMGQLVYDEESFSCGPITSDCYTDYSDINCEYHASIQYNYTLTEHQVAHAQLLGMMDELGVNLNPVIIWNAIPWSFVIDWVIGVNRWLDQFKRRNMEPVVNILKWCDSILYNRTFQGRKSCMGYMAVGNRSTSMPVVRETAYRRFTDWPSYNSFITSGLSPKEMSLGAALLITRT